VCVCVCGVCCVVCVCVCGVCVCVWGVWCVCVELVSTCWSVVWISQLGRRSDWCVTRIFCWSKRPEFEPNRCFRTALLWYITQRELVISYRRFGKKLSGPVCGGSRTHPKRLDPRRRDPIVSPETSVRNYHFSLRNDPEERISCLLRGGSLQSRCVLTSALFCRVVEESLKFNLHLSCWRRP